MDARTKAYRDSGYVSLPQFIPREVTIAFLARMQHDLAAQGLSFDRFSQQGPLLTRAAPELYSHHYRPLMNLHWGMTPIVTELVGLPLLPSYAYFRLYHEGDICKVHGDRLSCEHSLSLTLAYSDDKPWALELSPVAIDKPYERADLQFRPDEKASGVAMEAGDAVLYQGVHHHHGRTTPNPNRWSAHAFLHWVARDGPYADNAFDGQPVPETVTL